MENSHGSGKTIEDIRKLESIVGNCCEGVEGYKFVPSSFSYSYHKYIDGKSLIGIDEKLLSEVESLIKYDKKYLSALKMTVYHEIGHALFDRVYHNPEFREEIAVLYSISRGSIDDYIIDMAVMSKIAWDGVYEPNSRFSQTIKEPKDAVEFLLKKDSADKWDDKLFAYRFCTYESTEKVVKNAFDKIKLPYKEIFDRVLKEMERIDSLKRKNNLFIDKDMISRK